LNLNRRAHPDHVQVELGNAQRAVIGFLVAGLLAIGGIAAKVWSDWATRMDDRSSSQSAQLAVASAQLASIAVQLSAIPDMQRQIAVNSGQIARNADDIKELKSRLGK
jgi:hypothetical protein